MNQVTVLFMMIISAVFVVSVACLLRPILRIGRRFQQASGRLSSALRQAPEPPVERSRWRATITRQPFSDRKLDERWDRFVELWHDSRPHADATASVADVSDCFDPIEVIGGWAGLRRIEAIPGVLLTLGILGTFLGLVLGLRGIDVSNSERLLATVRGLINGLNTAFLTSVAGVIASLLFVFFEKLLISCATAQVESLWFVARAAFPSIPQSIHSARQLEQVQILKSLSNDLSCSINEAFSTTIEKNLGPMVGEIRDALKVVTQQASEAQVAGLERIVGQFVAQMDSAMGNQLSGLSQVMGRLSSELESVVTRLQEAAETQSQVMQHTAKASEVLGSQLPALLRFGDGMEAISKDLARALTEIEALRAQMNREATAAIRAQLGAAHAMETLEAKLGGATLDLSKAADAIRVTQQQIGSTVGEAASQFERNIRAGVVDILQAFDSKLGDILQRFSGTIAEVRESVEGLTEHGQELGNLVVASTSSLKEETDRFTPAVSKLSDVTEQLSRAGSLMGSSMERLLQEFTSSLSTATNELRDSRLQERPAESGVQASVDKLRESVEGFLSQQQETSSRTAGTMAAMRDSLQDLRLRQPEKPQQHVADISSRVDQTLSPVSNSVSDAVAKEEFAADTAATTSARPNTTATRPAAGPPTPPPPTAKRPRPSSPESSPTKTASPKADSKPWYRRLTGK